MSSRVKQPARSLLRISGAALLLAAFAALSGCDQLGIETPDKIAARQEAEAKAIGSACRNSGRAIEDCYTLNAKFSKAAIYTGWREMDEYMRENKLDVVRAVVPRPGAPVEDDEEDPPPKKTPANEAGANGTTGSKAASTPAFSIEKIDADKPAAKPARKSEHKPARKPPRDPQVEIETSSPSAGASRPVHHSMNLP